jgi:hypothetical protein
MYTGSIYRNKQNCPQEEIQKDPNKPSTLRPSNPKYTQELTKQPTINCPQEEAQIDPNIVF